jgi:3-isopropylmalate/(R)-2-methylmalate dehydratase large subunit
VTLAEKILAAHCDQKRVSPGDLINARVDLVLANDITGPISIQEFKKIGIPKVFDPQKVVMTNDHFVPNKDIPSAQQCKVVRDFSREQGNLFYDVGTVGIEHALLPEQGLVLPGDLVIGADSHTCTYGALGAFSTGMGSTDIAAAMATGEIWMRVPHTIRVVFTGHLRPWVGGKDLILYTIGQIGVDGALYAALQFEGEAIGELSIDGRLTMSNMAIEAGGKAGLFRVDQKTIDYVRPRAKRPFTVYEPDLDAEYAQTLEFDASLIEPQVAFPHLPSNAKPISQAGNVEIDQVVLGSCTNGRISDLEIAAQVLGNHKVHPRVRFIVIPATQEIYLHALRQGWIEQIVTAGGVVSTPTCGPCLGGYMGILAEGERCLSTTNRNFVGRMGHRTSEVYLAGPAVAAASAVLGRIGSPDDLSS